MSEKLTVAELLARNGRDISGTTGGRRRRRRSVDEGGVTVAELTGSIPVVTDSDVAKAEAEQAAEREAAEKAAAEKAAAEKAEREAAEKAAAEKAEREAKEAAEREAAEKAAREKAERERAERERAEREAAERRAAEEAEAQRIAQEKAAAEQAEAEAAALREAAAREEREAAARAEQSTPNLPPAVAGAQPIPMPDDTLAKLDEWEEDEDDAVAAEGTVSAVDETAVQPVISDEDLVTVDPAYDAQDDHADLAEEELDPEAEHPVAEDAVEDEDDAEPAEPVEYVEYREADGELPHVEDEDVVVEYEDDSVSVPALLGQAAVGILAGVGVFYGFGIIWASLPTIVALVLALAVTAVMVGIVHALLRHRDGMLMVLAAIVGLVLTVGPRLIMGI